MPQHKVEPEPEFAVALPASALDMVPLGIAKTDREGRFTYANLKMLRIAGLDDWRGRTIADIFRGDALAIVLEQMKRRYEQRVANEYPVDLTREDGRVIPLSITAFPETNDADEVVGTLALVRDLTVERAQQRMYRLVEKESESDKLLDAIAEALRPLVPFDRLQVIRLNQERTHLRAIYPKNVSGNAAQRAYRWWRIPDSIAHLLNSRDILVINDLLHWYRDPSRRSMLEDPAVKAYLAEGFVATMSLPVSQNNEQVASIVLSRKPGRPFSDEEKHVADVLPLAEAVSVALRNETEGNLTFLLELMKHISAAYESVDNVAQTIVDKISEHYDWDYVSIYQVYEQRGKIHLIAQKAKTDALRSTRKSYPLDEGIIGHVFREKHGVIIDDIDTPEFIKVYIPHSKIKTRSELCVPIGSRWLLNVEDEKSNAFAPEEKRDLEAIATSLSSLLNRTLEYQYRSAIFSRANDAILLTDERGIVFEVNPAASTLFRVPKERIKNRSIEEFFVDTDEARNLLGKDSLPNSEVVMRRATKGGAAGDEINVLLSIATLSEETGEKIFVASDMTQVERLRQLEKAQDLYGEVTSQVKTPMSLAISWLRRHARRNALGSGDVSHKVIQQLLKAELTLDRMMLIERDEGDHHRHDVLISMDDLVESILSDMPDREREVVLVTAGAHGAYVRANAYELRYCLQTVLSYLLRLAAEVDRIRLETRPVDNEVEVAVGGRSARIESAGDIDTACRNGQVRAEMSLGNRTLARIASRNRGRYAETASPESEHVTFSFTFPIVNSGARS